MSVYTCYFKVYNNKVAYNTEIPDIATAKEGFWVDKCWEYTNKSDNVWWVPPSAIIGVEKEAE